MQDLFIEFLPPWVETNLQPAFYDRESGTVLQQTARMYGKINEVIKAVNGMVFFLSFNYMNQHNVNETPVKAVLPPLHLMFNEPLVSTSTRQ